MNELVILILMLAGLSLVSGYIFHRTRRIIPYIHSEAKVRAWKANLISEPRLYEFAESPKTERILTALEDTGYQTYLTGISMENGIELEEVEDSLNLFLNDRYSDILEIVPEEREGMIERIVGIVNVHNLKGIVIGIERGLSEEKMRRYLVPSPTFSEERLEMLTSAETMDGLLEYLEGFEYSESLSEALEEKYEEEGISSLLRALDKAYYQTLWEEVRGKEAQRSVLETIIGTKLDMENIKMIMRMKKDDVTPARIDEFLIPSYHLSDEQIRSMTSAEDMDAAGEVVRDTIYGPAVREGLNRFKETGSLSDLERVLDEQFLRGCRRVSRTQPFSLASLLEYIYSVRTEVKNLRIIIGLKEAGVEPERIRKKLIVGREIE